MSEHGNGQKSWTESDEMRLVELIGSLEDDVRAPVGFHASVMREVAKVPVSPRRRAVDWWLRPRSVRVSPALGALAVAASAVLFFLSPTGPEGAGVGREAPSQVVTRFVLVAPGASSVQLTGDFLSWSREGIELEDLRGSGVWTADVPLPPGVYQYWNPITEQWEDVSTPYWSRKDADKIFLKIMLEDGFPPIRAKVAYRAVRLFGGIHSKNLFW